MNTTPIPLFHGTSTLFLNSIMESGLGGINPILDWKVLEFARSIYPMVLEHFSQDPGWMSKVHTFGLMVHQNSSAFQHGETYLTPSPITAINYAIGKRVGSELLSYALDFLQALVIREVAGVIDILYRDYPSIFGFLDVSCAPLLIEIKQVPVSYLADENGGRASRNLEVIDATLKHSSSHAGIILQQTNFRLKHSLPLEKLTFWLINVSRYHWKNPEFTLHPILISSAHNHGISESLWSGFFPDSP